MEIDNLKRSIVIGAAWMMGMRLTYRLIGFISTMILARLLTPDDFGVVAIAMSFMVLLDFFSRLGFQTVLIQKKNPTTDHYNTAWTFNLLFGLLSFIVFISISKYIAEFYGRQEIEYIFLVVSLLFLMNGAKNIGVVDFQKHMTFDKEFKLIIIPKFISFFVTIGLAFYLKNYWALVLGNVAWKLIELIASYQMHPFRPKFCINKGKELFNFSKWLMINNIFLFINSRAPDLILGKIISPHGAAIYNLSYEIGTMSTSEVVASINRSIYPGYSKIKNDLIKLQDLYQTSIKAIAILAMPLGTGVALMSPFLVPVILGEQWIEAISPLSYIALGAGINALKSNTSYILYAIEKPRISTLDLAIKSTIFLSLLIFLIDINGVVGAAQAFMLTSLISLVVSFFVLKYSLKISVRRQLIIFLKPLLATLVMAIIVSTATIIAPLKGLLALVCYSTLGAISYTIITYLLWIGTGKPSGLEEKVIKLVKSKFLKSQ